MKKRFIVLIDFSEYSNNLIRYACDWGIKINAELMLVHQTSILAPALTDTESRKQLVQDAYDDAMQKLEALAKELIPSRMKVSYSVSESHLQLTITNLLQASVDNLIFVGLKGAGFLKKIFLGSVSLQVIENSKNIVVAMPKEIATFSHGKIFIAVTEKYPLNLLELNKLLNYIDRENTNITFFYLAKPSEKTSDMEKQLRDLTALFAEKFNTNFAIYEGSTPFEDIKKVINNKVNEMLIVQKGSRLLTDQLFRKFLINELVYEGQTPLIILP